MGGSLDIKDLTGFAEPLTKLVETVGGGCAALFEPVRIRRRAHAEAAAVVVEAKAKAKAQSIEARAVRRIALDDVRHQYNLESIVTKAARALPERVDERVVDPDWIAQFLEDAKNTSNDQVQELWARLLAGEVAAPGSFSRRVISLIKTMDSTDAELFAKVVNLSIDQEGGMPVVDFEQEFVETYGLQFDKLQHLDAIGLIRFDSLAGFCQLVLQAETTGDRKAVWSYCGRQFTLNCNEPPSRRKPDCVEISIGSVVLTKNGTEMSRLVERTFSEDVFQYLLRAFADYHAEAVIESADATRQPTSPSSQTPAPSAH